MRKKQLDLIVDFGEINQRLLIKHFYEREAQVNLIFLDYLSRKYPDVFRSHNSYIRWSLLPFDKCIVRLDIQKLMMKEIKSKIKNVEELVRLNKRDDRIALILQKYHEVFDYGKALEAYEEGDIKEENFKQVCNENLLREFMPGYEVF